MGGYMVASPLFAHLVSLYEPFFVMAAGLLLWSIATITCGFAPNFFVLLMGRILTGFGEASFLCIAPPLIDKLAPNGKKSLWLSVFYCAIPVGYAFGFAVSGGVLAAEPFGSHWSWRSLFVSESLVMLPFVVFALFNRCPFSFKKPQPPAEAELTSSLTIDPDEQLGHAAASAYTEEPTMSAAKEVWDVILSNKVYVMVVLGYAAQTFVTGGLAFFGLDYAKEELGLSPSDAGILFGGVTVVTGICGTMSGGILLDWLRHRARVPSADKTLVRTDDVTDLRDANNIKDRLDSIKLAIQLTAAVTALAFPFSLLAFVLPGTPAFFINLLVAEMLLFCCYSPLNNAVMWSVPFAQTPLAMAFSVVVMHLLGDSLSPTLIGAVYSALDDKWRPAMIACVMALALAVVLWLLGLAILSRINTKPIQDYQYDFEHPLRVPTGGDKVDWQQASDVVAVEQGSDPVAVQAFANARVKMCWAKHD
jgi:MFS family permease